MRLVIFSILLLTTSACGRFATKEDLKKANDRINDLKKEVKILENDFKAISLQFEGSVITATNLQAQITDLNVVIDNLENNAEAQSLLVADLNTKMDQLLITEATINILQSQLDAVQLKLTELEMQDNVVEVVDPCPQPLYTGYAEVLMKLPNDVYIAFFKTGNSRKLSVLKQNKTYKTTDDRACKFKINVDNEIELL